MSERTELPSADLRPTQTCETCRFWKPKSDNGANGSLCLRYPPVLNVVAVRRECRENDFDPHESADIKTCWSYPRVEDYDWCGEWQAKQVEAESPKFTEQQLSLLDPGEENVIRLRYGIGRNGTTCKPFTLKDTARILQTTQERVRQIESKAVRRMVGIPPRAK